MTRSSPPFSGATAPKRGARAEAVVCIPTFRRPQMLAARLGWVLQRSLATGAINCRIDRLAARSFSARALRVAKNIALAPISFQRAVRHPS